MKSNQHTADEMRRNLRAELKTLCDGMNMPQLLLAVKFMRMFRQTAVDNMRMIADGAKTLIAFQEDETTIIKTCINCGKGHDWPGTKNCSACGSPLLVSEKVVK